MRAIIGTRLLVNALAPRDQPVRNRRRSSARFLSRRYASAPKLPALPWLNYEDVCRESFLPTASATNYAQVRAMILGRDKSDSA